MRAGGPARTVALRACISMREGCEKGTLERRRDARRGRREKRTRKEGRKRGGLDEVQKQEDKGKKAGKKGLFELSLCAKQLPENVGWLGSFTCRPITDTVYRGIDVSAEAPSRRSFRAAQSSGARTNAWRIVR